MNTPLVLFNNYLPIEIIFYIQRYVSNNIVFDAIKKHIQYSYIYNDKDNDNDLIMKNYYTVNLYIMNI